MNFDGTRWKQPILIDDNNYLIEISYSCKTKMLAMLQKANTKLSPTPIESSQQG